MQKANPAVRGKLLLLLRMIIGTSFLCAGLFYELFCAMAAAALFLWLYAYSKHFSLVFRWNAASMTAIGFLVLYILSPLWAVDKGLAVWGVVRFLPVPLAAFCLMQLSPDERKQLYGDLPCWGVLMTLVSFLLQFIPRLTDTFSVSGRLAGFFGYPNTFACFLLLGIIVLLFFEEQGRWKKTATLVILSAGLLLSGSRAVFVLAVATVFVSLFLAEKRSFKNILPLVAGAVVGIVLSLLGNRAAAQHLQEINTGASTFLGRLLYWKDALPVILRHPLGLGYLGYYFSQGSIQTGVYSVRTVHNDLLQLMLEIGWLPAVLAVAALVQSLCSKRISVMQKVFLLTLLAHCCFDFDLSFISMYFLLFLSLDLDEGKPKKRKISKSSLPAAAIVGISCFYIGIASMFSYAGNAQIAQKLYPWDTFSNITLLTETSDVETLQNISETVLRQNDSVALAWDAKANVAYSNGDFTEMIRCKRKAISLARYSIEEYTDYFEKLKIGRELYLAAGDTASAEVCQSEMVGIQAMVEDVLADTDNLAWKINDKPALELPEEYYQYIAALS